MATVQASNVPSDRLNMIAPKKSNSMERIPPRKQPVERSWNCPNPRPSVAVNAEGPQPVERAWNCLNPRFRDSSPRTGATKEKRTFLSPEGMVVFSPNKQEKTKRSASSLCARCQQIDFQDIFSQTQHILPFHGRLILHLDEIPMNTTCAACRLLHAVALPRAIGLGGGYDLRIFSAAATLGGKSSTLRERKAIALAVLPGRGQRGVISYQDAEYLDGGVVLAKENRVDLTADIGMAAVQALQIDYDRLKAWLGDCDSSHTGSCGIITKASGLKVPLRCIDCNTGVIKPIENGDHYFALSYVWGTAKSTVSDKKPAYLSQVPNDTSQVIRDAMEVVKQLGKRYLWVDKYCIDQSCHDTKAIQIMEMDLIYAGAYATIVASAGPDEDYGIPGVSRGRSNPPSFSIGQLDLGSSLPAFHYAVKETVWSQRAWTYQEAVLSRRCIFFTEQQVYFHCRKMRCCEAVKVQHRSQLGKRDVDLGMMNADMFQRKHRSTDGSPWWCYTYHVTEYSGRVLTYEADKLNAFRGVLSRIPFYTFYGVPMALDDDNSSIYDWRSSNIGIARGLWWSPVHQPLRRIRQFPSWSWAGWQGVVQYCSGFDAESRHQEKLEPIVGSLFDTRFWLEDSERNQTTFQEVAQSLSGTKLLPELSYSLVIEAKVFQFRFEQWHLDEDLICECHRKRLHEDNCFPLPVYKGSFVPREVWGYVVFFELDRAEPDALERILTTTWDCVLLFEDATYHCSLLIIEWHGDVASRVGNLQVGRHANLYTKPSCRRKIRMV
jgi:hypothetical protein